ncbi:MAG: hypothetical protein AAF907_09080 [Planctomycetota bacterium]
MFPQPSQEDPQRRRRTILPTVSVVCLLVAQGVNVVWMSPVWLSSYSAVVGGLWGADKLGFERNYWGDAVTRELLNAADESSHPDAPFFIAPALHQFADEDRAAASPAVRLRNEQWETLNESARAAGLGIKTEYRVRFGYHESKSFGTIRFARHAYWDSFEGTATNDLAYSRMLLDWPSTYLPGSSVVARQGVVLAAAPTSRLIPEPTLEQWKAMFPHASENPVDDEPGIWFLPGGARSEQLPDSES